MILSLPLCASIVLSLKMKLKSQPLITNGRTEWDTAIKVFHAIENYIMATNYFDFELMAIYPASSDHLQAPWKLELGFLSLQLLHSVEFADIISLVNACWSLVLEKLTFQWGQVCSGCNVMPMSHLSHLEEEGGCKQSQEMGRARVWRCASGAEWRATGNGVPGACPRTAPRQGGPWQSAEGEGPIDLNHKIRVWVVTQQPKLGCCGTTYVRFVVLFSNMDRV